MPLMQAKSSGYLSEIIRQRMDAALRDARNRRRDLPNVRQFPAHVSGTPLLALRAGFIGRPVVHPHDIDHRERDTVGILLPG
ncbi:hypothetical protein [Burkholderia cepacia]|uniref:hypothetical protein n=1 Tax=Burkholderia cepacia TaxID=292 RepID=UPI002FDFA6B7